MMNPAADRTRASLTKTRPGVLVLVSSLSFGGAEKHAVSLVNSLDASQFRLLLCHIKSADTLLRELDRSQAEAVFTLAAAKGIDPSAVRSLAERIDSNDIDVIVGTNGFSVMYALAAMAFCSKRPKVIGVFHTTLVGGFKSRLRMLLHKRAFKRCDLLVYVSEAQRRWWEARGLRARSETVIQNGINVERFTSRSSIEDRRALRATLGFGAQDYVVGICAALRREKAHIDLLQAISRLRTMEASVKLMIIGDGQERSSIEKNIQALGLGNCVAITGYRQDVRPFIEACDVMVLCSHAVETFSIAALEAMALGKPLVLTRIGGAEEQVIPGKNGYLYEPGDIDALTGHLRELADPERRNQMGARGAQLVRERFTVEKMAGAFAQEIERVITPSVSTARRMPMPRLAK
jgi:glycosyltransferase involved in cell wall biosynthesis